MNDLHPSILIDTRHGIPKTKTQVDRIVEWVWRDAHARVAARLAKEPHKFDRREPMPVCNREQQPDVLATKWESQ